MKKYTITALISFAAVTFSSSSYSVEPLSCQMVTLLSVTAAMLRDQGRSKEDIRKILAQEGELTKKEINMILKTVFVDFKNRSPREIEVIFDAACGYLN